MFSDFERSLRATVLVCCDVESCPSVPASYVVTVKTLFLSLCSVCCYVESYL